MRKIEISGGDTIHTACEEAIRQAQNGIENVSFMFNDLEIVATPQSTTEQMVKKYYVDHQARYDNARNQKTDRIKRLRIQLADEEKDYAQTYSTLP